MKIKKWTSINKGPKDSEKSNELALFLTYFRDG